MRAWNNHPQDHNHVLLDYATLGSAGMWPPPPPGAASGAGRTLGVLFKGERATKLRVWRLHITITTLYDQTYMADTVCFHIIRNLETMQD